MNIQPIQGTRFRRLLMLGITLMAFQPEIVVAGTSPGMARVARRIAQKKDWLAAAQRCPADTMPKRTSIVEPGQNRCKLPYDTCLTKCEEGDGVSCYWLAYQLQEDGAEVYEPLYQRACQLGVVSGCTNRAAGMLKEQKSQNASIEKCTARTFQIACEYEDPWACTMYALQLSRGLGVAQNDALALKILDKSCKYGETDPACEYAKGLRQDILSRRSKPPDAKKRKQ